MKKIILIAGPSAAGKTIISHYLYQKFNIPRVITHTTRPKRAGEKNKESYYFETNDSFAKLHFFEHVTYGQFQYGSSREALKKAWNNHDIVSLIVDIKGVKSYLTKLKDKVYFLYVTTSSFDELKIRMIQRGDNIENIKKRLSGSELNSLPTSLKPYAHVLYNDSWLETVRHLDAIVTVLKAN